MIGDSGYGLQSDFINLEIAGTYMSYRLGVDVGGTFTDLLLVNEGTGQTWTAKVPSTPADQSIGVLNGLARVCERAGISPDHIEHVMHGTTVATNTVLTGSGARCGLVTTKGYRQVLQIARSFVPGGLGGWVIYNKSLPMAPLACTIEANERVGAKGDIVTKLDEKHLRKQLQSLRSKNIEALTVSLVNAYANDVHEKRIKAIAAEELPGIPVSLSSEVVPEMQEYERTVTTVANSYVRPRVQKYVHNLTTKLASNSKNVKLHILRSDGGLASAKSAEEYPVNLLMSGPAGGVTGALWVAVQAGFPNLLTVDVGGTSTDVALIMNGEPRLRRETTVGDVTVRASSVDIRTVGAGGGSIAWIDAGGLLCVGPESAGADPGPACYARGNERPTVTDANMVLGFLNPESLAGGSLKVDPSLSALAVRQGIGTRLGLNDVAAAHGIRRVANVNMARAIRAVTVERGRDPRDMTMIAFGGGGPLHAVDVAKILGIKRVIAPVMAGVFCSAGMLSANAEHHFVKALVRPFSECQESELAQRISVLQTQGREVLNSEGYEDQHISFTLGMDLRYLGQSGELTVPVPNSDSNLVDLNKLARDFRALYETTFGYQSDEPLELVNIRVVAYGKSPARLNFSNIHVDSKALLGVSGKRLVSFETGVPSVEATLMSRGEMTQTRQQGPLIIESYDTTIVVPPDASAWADPVGNIVIDIEGN